MMRLFQSRLRAMLVALITTLTLFAMPQAALAKGFSSGKVSGSVVYVAISDGNSIRGNGSGFIVAPGIVVTNSHVASAGRRLFVIKNGDNGTNSVEATPILISRRNDIAILRAPGLRGPALTIAAGEPALGVDAWAMGYPALADAFSAEERALASLTTGTVSRVLRGRAMTSTDGETTRLVQHSAVIAPGSSGGPLFDACYRVIGINTQISSQSGTAYVFAIASSVLPGLLRQAGVKANISTAGCGDSPPAGKAPPGADDSAVQGGGSGGTGGNGRADDAYRSVKNQRPSGSAGGGSGSAGGDDGTGKVVQPDAPVQPLAPGDANRQALEDARRRAADARRRAAEAEEARKRAIAANDKAEADRQAQIADNARKAADDLDSYSSRIEDQIEAIKPDPLDRYLPLGLFIAALILLSGIGWWGAQAYSKARRQRDAKMAQLRAREAEAADMAGQDVALVSPDGALKLPGAKLKQGLVLGRSAQRADVILPKESVGRAHARFVMRDGRLFVSDLGSANGTFINDARLSSGAEQEVRDGDRLAFSPLHAFKVRFH